MLLENDKHFERVEDSGTSLGVSYGQPHLYPGCEFARALK